MKGDKQEQEDNFKTYYVEVFLICERCARPLFGTDCVHSEFLENQGYILYAECPICNHSSKIAMFATRLKLGINTN